MDVAGRQTNRSRSHSFLLAQVGTYYYTPPQRVSLFAYVDGTKTVSFILLMRFFCTFYSQCKVCVSFSVSLPLTPPGHKSPCQRESAGGWANKQTDRQRMTTTVTDWMGVRDRQSGREWTRPCRKWDCLALVTSIDRRCDYCVGRVVVEGGGQECVRRENRLMASTFLNRA